MKKYNVELSEEQIKIIKYLVNHDITDLRVNDRYANKKEIIEADKEILTALNNAIIDTIYTN